MKLNAKTLILFSFCIWMTANTINAQATFPLSGTVQNEASQSLELANVIAYSLKDSTVKTFAITDYNGNFKLELEQDSSYLLKAVYLGYKEWSEVVKVRGESIIKTIVLKPSHHELQEVTVVYEMPVIVRGDTVSFKTDAFTSGKERKLKDVFEKLPGFEVQENGAVKVNGKKVDKITVDGKDFFTGDTKLAANNIPANVVDKVNVLRNHNDVSQMKSLNDDNGLAIDISLKGDKQNIVFGSIEAGGGTEERYLGHANLFYFHPKGSVNFIGNANNIGEQVFTFQDFLRFNGGITSMANKNGAKTRLSSESLGLVPLKDNKSKNTNAKIAALNFTYNPGSKLSFSGFMVGTMLESDLLNVANRTYIGLSNNGDNTENLSSSRRQKSRSGILKINTKYIPNSNVHLEHNLMIKNVELNKSQLLQSENSFADRYLNSDDFTEMPSMMQDLNLFVTLHPKHLISLECSQFYNDKTTAFEIKSKEPIYTTAIPLIDDDSLSLIQNQQLKTHKLDGALTHYYLMNKTNHLGFTIGATINDQKLYSALSQNLTTGEALSFDQEELQNDVDYQYRDAYAGIHYKSRFGKLTIKPSLYVHDFNLRNEQIDEVENLRKQLLLPSFYAKYDFKKSTSLKLDYAVKAEFYDAQQYARGGILRNYNNLFRGNARLENSWYHNVELNFYSLNLYNFTNIYGILSYQRRYDNLNNQIVYDQLDRISRPLNIADPNDLLTIYGAVDKRFKNFKGDLTASVNLGRFNNVLADSEIILNENFTQNYSASVETTMDNFPIIEIGFETIINQYKTEALATQIFTTNRPFANIELSFFRHFILTMDYEFNWYNNKKSNTSSTYDVLNAELFFRKADSRFEFKLAALNLLNTTSIREDTFSEVLISTSEYYIQKRYFLGSLKIEF